MTALAKKQEDPPAKLRGKLPFVVYPEIKPEPEDDPVFFHKGQIVVGSKLEHRGRLGKTLWHVVRIETRQQLKDELGRNKPLWSTKIVSEVHRLNDDVVLKLDGHYFQKTMTFQYLSYSAIWMLVGNAKPRRRQSP
jgi:hypothetical protein